MSACKLRSCSILFTLISSSLAATAFATEHGFEFTGGAIAVLDEPYDIPITQLSEIFGGFVYESNTTNSYAIEGCDCTGYRHGQINGLWVSFAGVKVQADEYIVEVRNNIEVIPFGTMDIISWLFPGVADPTLDTSLLVGGIPFNDGRLRVDLVAFSNLFDDSSLPEDIDPNDFALTLPATFDIFGDQIDADGEIDENDTDVLFQLQTLSEVPLLESDHDLDGDVDGRDFLIWQRYYGAETGNGDANSDLSVDEDDLMTWQTQYGSSVPAMSAVVAVPEPDTALMLVGYMLCIGGRPVRYWLRTRSN